MCMFGIIGCKIFKDIENKFDVCEMQVKYCCEKFFLFIFKMK